MQQHTFGLVLLPSGIGSFAMNCVGLGDGPEGLL
jgi:hypothetical protein